MKCPKCNKPMIELLTSFVCDNCNPSKNNISTSSSVMEPGHINIAAVDFYFDSIDSREYPFQIRRCGGTSQKERMKFSLEEIKDIISFIKINPKPAIKLTFHETDVVIKYELCNNRSDPLLLHIIHRATSGDQISWTFSNNNTSSIVEFFKPYIHLMEQYYGMS